MTAMKAIVTGLVLGLGAASAPGLAQQVGDAVPAASGFTLSGPWRTGPDLAHARSGLSAAVMDGNVERVMARLHAVETPLPDVKP